MILNACRYVLRLRKAEPRKEGRATHKVKALISSRSDAWSGRSLIIGLLVYAR
jgi:hypothetical protein